MQISADALFQRAARLPRVDVRKPCRLIGTSTVEAIESGLYYGYAGLVDGLVRRMRDQLGANAMCIATGGLAGIIAPEVKLIEHVDEDLTLQGLRMVWERNRPTKQ
jgi:type III pantothenate kinase